MERSRLRRRRYTVRVVVPLIVGALVLGACGGEETAANRKSTTTAAGTGTATLPDCPTDALAKATAPVEITFWHAMTRANQDALVKLTDAFNAQQSKVKVTLVGQTSDSDLITKFKAGLAGGDLPDLMQQPEYATQFVTDTEQVIPAESCIKADEAAENATLDPDQIVDRARAYYTVNGNLAALPFAISDFVLLYNTQAFEKAGLDPDKPPSTLAELQATTKTIAQKTGMASPFSLKVSPAYLEQWSAKAGALYANNDNGRTGERSTAAVFDNKTGTETFDFLHDFVASGLAHSTGLEGYTNLLEVPNGQAALTIDSSGALGTIVQLLGTGQYPQVTLGVAPMPGPEGPGGVLVGGSALWVVKQSSAAKEAAAWEFAKYLASAKVQAEWAAATGYVPSNKGATDEQVLKDAWVKVPGLKVAYDQLLEGENTPATTGPLMGPYLDVRKSVGDQMLATISGGKAPAAALRQAQTEATALLKDYAGRVGG